MTSDVAQLGIRIDSSQAKTAIADLDKLAAVGAKVEKSTDSIAKASTAGAGATKQITAAMKEQASVLDSVAKAQTIQASASTASAAAAAKSAEAATRAGSSFNSFAAGQKLTAYQSQQLSYQLNDLFVQISSGQSPLTALIQQGSQLNGQFGGLGGTLRALGSLFTVSRVAIGGVVGSVIALGAAFLKGRSESDDFAKSIALTGNAAGITEGRYNEMAKTIALTTSTSIASTRATLAELVSSGNFTGASLESAARAAQGLAKVSGESTEDISRSFAKAGNDVVGFAQKMNDQYHFLTAAQLDYIRTLDQQGNSQRALEITFNALNARIAQAAGNVGTLERGWNAVKVAASNAVNAMLEIGRVPTPESKLADLNKQLSYLQQFGGTAERVRALKEEVATQQEILNLGRRGATIAAESAQREQAKTAFLKLQDQVLSKQEQRTREIAKANALADKAGASAAERAKVIANIEEKYKDPKIPKAKDYQDDAATKFLETLRQTESALSAQLAGEAQVTDAVREQVKFQQLIADLKEKKILTAEQKSLLANKDSLSAQLEKNVGLSNQIKFEEKIADIVKKSAADAEALKRTVAGIDASIASGAEGRSEQYDRMIDTAGLGEQARQMVEAEKSIRAEFRRYQLRVDQEFGDKDALGSDSYTEATAKIKASLNDALAAQRRYYADELAARQDWKNGATAALADYQKYVDDVAGSTGRTIADSFKGAEDVLVKFVTTGKLSFQSLADSIIANLARMAIQQTITGPLASLLGGLFGGGASASGGSFGSSAIAIGGSLIGGRAIGGPVSANSLYQVNEKGPGEVFNVAGKQYLMTGSQGGSVSPAGGGGGDTYHYNFTVGDVATVSTVREAVAASERRTQNGFRRSRSYAGEAS